MLSPWLWLRNVSEREYAEINAEKIIPIPIPVPANEIVAKPAPINFAANNSIKILNTKYTTYQTTKLTI
jgi:hypothetical protein